MADLEKLAIKRDRGYLVKLILMLVAAFVAGGFLFSVLTSARVTGCMADAFVGSDEKGAAAETATPE
jgi:hypothetical protein